MLIDYFDKYVAIGLQPIAVFPFSKRPVGANWNKNWTPDRWRSYFEADKYNMGILLGDVIDVEGDTDDANERLERMIGNAPHPMFKSNKSVHHLFRNPDPNLTRAVFYDIEFRGYLHQSVVPPSCHEEGVQYKFLKASRFPVPAMPGELLDFYLKYRVEKRAAPPPRRLKKGYTKTCCKICTRSVHVHKKRLMLEVRAFQEYGLPWMCHKCREMDMRDACRRIRKQLERPTPLSYASILEDI